MKAVFQRALAQALVQGQMTSSRKLSDWVVEKLVTEKAQESDNGYAEYVAQLRQQMALNPDTFATGRDLVGGCDAPGQPIMCRHFGLNNPAANGYIQRPTLREISFYIHPNCLMQLTLAVEQKIPHVKFIYHPAYQYIFGETLWPVQSNEMGGTLQIEPPDARTAAHAYDTLVEIFLDLLGSESDEEPYVRQLNR